MEYFPAPLSRTDSDAFVDRVEACFDQRRFGFWAVDLLDSGEFIGFIGLWPANFDAHFTPAIEAGWRLASRHWGSGLAPEGARAAIAAATRPLPADASTSRAVTGNVSAARW